MTIRISKNKLMILAICLLLILNFSIFTTMAWMTDSAEVVNTFTVGKVDIDLEETDVDEDGNIRENKYHLIPGEEYVKDPTMTVKADSEESYLRIILTVHNASAVKEVIAANELESFFDFLGGWDKDIWKLVKTTEDAQANTMTFEFRYKETVSGFNEKGEGVDVVLPALFTTLKVPGSLTMEDLDKLQKGGFKMVIEGHAIQKAGFDTEAEAWAAFVKEDK